MADHVVIQVRNALMAKVTGLATAGANVFKYSERAQAVLPCIVVHYAGDTDQRVGLGIPTREDIATVYLLHLLVKNIGDCEQIAMNMRSEIETVLLGSTAGNTLDGIVQKIDRSSCQPDEADLLDKPCYHLVIQLDIRIVHNEGLPTSFQN